MARLRIDGLGGANGIVCNTRTLKPRNSEYYQLSFGKRPTIELHDCQQDPDQINNWLMSPIMR